MARNGDYKILPKRKSADIVGIRGKDFITKRDPPTYPRKTRALRSMVNETLYVIQANDNWYKIAHRFYGNKDMWYIIAWYNKIPSDTLLKTGETLTIPASPEVVLNFMETRGIDYYA